MSCEEMEVKFQDFLEQKLSPAERKALANHLTGCADCRALVRQWQQLDAACLAQIKVPALSADFDRRLWEVIQITPGTLSAEQRAERKRALQSEFETGLARIGRGTLGLGSLGNHLCWPAVAALAGGFAWLITANITINMNVQRVAGISPLLLDWLVASAALLIVGVVFLRQGKIQWTR